MSAGLKGGQTEGLQYFVGATGTYDTGLTPVSVDSNGNLVQEGGLLGAALSWGAFGTHRARRYTIGLNYYGAYRHYNGNTYYNGLDTVLSLDIGRQMSKRLDWLAVTSAGSVAASFGSWLGFSGYFPGLAPPGVPATEIYDNRNYFAVHTESLTYELSPRWYLTAAGTGMVIRRQSNALVGLDGYGAMGTLSYRLSRPSSISLRYSWDRYDYPDQYGEAVVNQLLAGYTREFSRRWVFELSAGGFRMETKGLTQVSADPAVAALFGQTTITERYYADRYYPAGSAQLTGRFRRATVLAAYSMRPSPGNGVYLGSSLESAGASVSYTGARRWNFGGNMTFSRLTSVAQQIGSYGTWSVGGGTTYRLMRNLSATFRADSRIWQVNQANGETGRSYRLTFGVAISPSDIPLALW